MQSPKAISMWTTSKYLTGRRSIGFVRLRSPTLTTHGVRGKEKSEPRVLRVSTAIYQHPPTISCGEAKMEAENNGRWTKRPKETRGSKRTESNIKRIQKCGTKKGRHEEENFSQETGLPKVSKNNYPPFRRTIFTTYSRIIVSHSEEKGGHASTGKRRKSDKYTTRAANGRCAHSRYIDARLPYRPGFKNQLMFADATAKSLGGVR